MTATLEEPECVVLQHLADGEKSARLPCDGIVAFENGPEVPVKVLTYMEHGCTPPLISVTGIYPPESSTPIHHGYELTAAGRIALSRCDEVRADRSVTLSDEELSVESTPQAVRDT